MRRLIPYILFLISTVAYGQDVTTTALSLGVEVGFPTNSIYNIGFGGSAKAEIPLAQALSLSLTGGYTGFHFKSGLIGSNSGQPASTYVPLKAGLKYFFGEAFYVEGEAGNVFETNYNKNNLFAFALGPGFLISTGKHTAVDFGFRYENWGGGRFRQTGVRASYRFGR